MSAAPDLVNNTQHSALDSMTSPGVAIERLPEGSLLCERYRVGSLIGAGGMSSVYRGHDERLGRDVAIKVLNPAGDTPQPPLREERVSSTLIHPNIVSIFDAGDIADGQPGGGRSFIIMQHVPGTTGHDIVPVPWERAVNIVRQACEGLAAAHERGIVHCDVKPSNLLIEPGGRVLVADFGVAASLDTEVGDYVHGSPAYIAPERLQGARPDPRFDVYGLGGVLAFLLTGSKPATDVDPALPDNCPAGVRQVVLTARSQEPSKRYATAREMAVALERAMGQIAMSGEDRVVGEEPTKVIRPGAGSSAPSPGRRVERVHTPRPTRVVRASSARLPRETGRPASSGTIEMPSPFETFGGQRREISGPVVVKPVNRPHRGSVPVGRFGTVLALVAATVAAVVLGGMLFAGTGTETSSAAAPVTIAMPDLRGQTFGAAVESLAGQGLSVDRVEIIYDPASLNQIIVQSPEPGTDVTQDDEIVLVVRSRQ